MACQVFAFGVNLPGLMNKKLIYLFFAVLILGILGILIGKQKVGDIRPALLPPSRNISEIVEKQTVGEAVEFPLEIPQDFQIGIFAKNLGNVRDLEFTQDGTLLLSIPQDGRVVGLPDKNGDGVVDEVKEVLTNLNRPHGLAFYNNKLFVVEETRVVRYNWDSKNLTASLDKVLFNLPAGGRHSTRTIAFDNSSRLFVSIGSTCDVCFEKHQWLGSVIVSDQNGDNPRLFAKGLRNSVFITVNPETNELWGTEMGRDFLGDFLPPDEINIIQEAKDYGWPLCYGNRVHDTSFDKKVYIQTVPPQPCGTTEPPIFEIAAHSAPLGLTFINSPQFPTDWQGDLLVAYHGSWNRSTPIGYKVVRIDLEGNLVKNEYNFTSGFLGKASGPAGALGRPVDLIFDKAGSLYISDDKAEVVYKITKK